VQPRGKYVTTGEGGMVLTNDTALAERCRDLHNLCFGTTRRFVHEDLGWNFRMSNLQAAIGVAQLEKLSQTIEKKRRIGTWYDELLADVEDLIDRLPAHTQYADNIYWLYGVVLRDGVPFDADEAMQRMAAQGIGTRPFFWPMHQQPVLRKMGFFNGESCPVAERIARRGFYIPSGVALTQEQAIEVRQALRRILA
jgi:perosamine synthetase